jgi:hypothetical protein
MYIYFVVQLIVLSHSSHSFLFLRFGLAEMLFLGLLVEH